MNIVFLKEKRDECSAKIERGTSRLYLKTFVDIYKTVKKNNKKPRQLLKEFQHAIRDISTWDKTKIKQEHNKFVENFGMIDSLVRSIFKIHLNIYNISHKSECNAVIPNTSKYIHEVYLNIARKLWEEPFLMYDVGVNTVTIQKNMIEIEKIIIKNIHETFLHMLPFKEFDLELSEENIKDDSDSINDDEDSDDNSTYSEDSHNHSDNFKGNTCDNESQKDDVVIVEDYDSEDSDVEDCNEDHKEECCDEVGDKQECCNDEGDKEECCNDEGDKEECCNDEDKEECCNDEDKEECCDDKEECCDDKEECCNDDDKEECCDDKEECCDDKEECCDDKEQCCDDKEECYDEDDVPEQLPYEFSDVQDCMSESSVDYKVVTTPEETYKVVNMPPPEETYKVVNMPPPEETYKVVNIPEKYEVTKTTDKHHEKHPEKHHEKHPEKHHEKQVSKDVKIINIEPRKTLSERKRLVKEKIKQRGYIDFKAPTDSFF